MYQQPISNQELAEAYLNTGCTGLEMPSRKKAQTIVGAEVNVQKYYQTNGTLNLLPVKGLGLKTHHVLEEILEHGPEEGIKRVVEGIKNASRTEQFRGVWGRSPNVDGYE